MLAAGFLFIVLCCISLCDFLWQPTTHITRQHTPRPPPLQACLLHSSPPPLVSVILHLIPFHPHKQLLLLSYIRGCWRPCCCRVALLVTHHFLSEQEMPRPGVHRCPGAQQVKSVQSAAANSLPQISATLLCSIKNITLSSLSKR